MSTCVAPQSWVRASHPSRRPCARFLGPWEEKKGKPPSDHHTPATATALLRAEVAVNFKKSQQISGEISVGSPRERIASDRRLRTPRRRLVRKSIRFVHALSWVLLVSTVRAGPRGALETSVPLAGGVRDPAAPVLGFLACKLVKSSWAFLPHFMVVAHRKKENEMKPSRR